MSDMLHNPVTGERVRWHLRSADTEGRLVRAEWWTRPGGGVAFEHAATEERFEVLSGRMAAEVGGRLVELGAGERVALPAGVPHRWWNAGGEELHLMLEVEPPGRFEQDVETLFGLNHNGGNER